MTKRNDITNYLGGWPKWFEEMGNKEQVAKPSELDGAFDTINKHLLNDKFSMDDMRLAQTALATHHANMMRSRDALVHKYLALFEAKASTSQSYLTTEHSMVRVRELEEELAVAKAKHLEEFGEELILSFRAVGRKAT